MAPMGPFCKPRVFTRGYDCQDIAYTAQKEGDEERMTWYYGKATGIKKSIETIEKMKNYGIIL